MDIPVRDAVSDLSTVPAAIAGPVGSAAWCVGALRSSERGVTGQPLAPVAREGPAKRVWARRHRRQGSQ
jgi:hypothetical protein